jgi:exopolysaccharide production protein ExoQ
VQKVRNPSTASSVTEAVIKYFVVIGCAVSFWAGYGSFGRQMQYLSLALLCVAAGLAISQRRFEASRLTVPELILFALTILSAAVSLSMQATPSMLYSIALVLTLIPMSILVRTFSLEEVLDVGAPMVLILAFCSLLFERNLLVSALSVTITRNGLVRFMPFQNHPNLTGFIFGAGTILLARRALIAGRRSERWLMSCAAVVTTVFVVAASARASLIALGIAGIFSLLLYVRLGTLLRAASWSGGALALLSIATPLGTRVAKYLGGILEFDSKTRGVGSGGTGRGDLWHQGIMTLVSDPRLLIFGGGLRSSDIDVIGFSTEDSYITILLDSGLFAGGAVIGVFLYCLVKSTRLALPGKPDRRSLLLLPSFMLFILFESIFNRYLLAIGNPMSLFILLILVSVSVRAVGNDSTRTTDYRQKSEANGPPHMPPVGFR